MEKRKCHYKFLLKLYNNKTIKKDLKKLKKRRNSPSINHLIVSIVEEYIMKEKGKKKTYLEKYQRNAKPFFITLFLSCLIYLIGMAIVSFLFPSIYLFLIIVYSIIPFYIIYYFLFNRKYPTHKTFFCDRVPSKCPQKNHYCKEIHPKCIYERLAKRIDEKLYDPIQITPNEIDYLVHKIPTSKGNIYFLCNELDTEKYDIDFTLPPNTKIIQPRYQKRRVFCIVDKDFDYTPRIKASI